MSPPPYSTASKFDLICATISKTDGITSPEALANPYDSNISFATFLNIGLLKNVITDTHFGPRSVGRDNRDRMGRLLTFLARLMTLPPKDFVGPPAPWMIGAYGGVARGLGVDARSAVLVEKDGAAKVVGDLPAYFLTAPAKPVAFPLSKPLTYGTITIVRLKPGGTVVFTANGWENFKGGVSYTVKIEDGVPTSSTGSLY